MPSLEDAIEDTWDDDEEPAVAPKHFDQASLVCDLMGLAISYGFKHLEQRQYDALIKAADLLYEELKKPHVGAPAACGIVAWWASDETGLSSKHMARVLWPLVEPRGKERPEWLPGPGIYDDEQPYPRDPDDFKRCMGLLAAVPELRPHLRRMADEGSEWNLYVDHWEKMEALMAKELPTGSAPKLYSLMQRLQDDARRSRAGDRDPAAAAGDAPQP
jgi:hypothetical protein